MRLSQCLYGVGLLLVSMVANGGVGVQTKVGPRTGLVSGSRFVLAGIVSHNISLSRWGMDLE
jgi:hypothetical protein